MFTVFFNLIAKIGVAPSDTEPTKNAKNLLVVLAILMSLGGILWGTLLVIFGIYLPMFIPYGYVILSFGNILFFYYTHNFKVARIFQLVISMLLPFGLQWMLGGFLSSGVVMLWATLALIGSVTVLKGKSVYGWLFFFISLTFISFALEPHITHFRPVIFTDKVSLSLLLANISIIISILFILAKLKVDQDLEIKNELTSAYEKLNIVKEEIQIKSELLSDALKNIMHSVSYAQYIQNAVLGSPTKLISHFKQGFVFWEPLEKVSGDFFWFTAIHSNAKNATKKILISADCTGHGIPGAFMTMMGSTLLEEIVNGKGITEPNQILYELDKKIVASLHKNGSLKRVNDGMDLGILVIDEEKQQACFSGAKTPLWYVTNQQIWEVKGSRFPVGSSQYNTPKIYTNHTINLEKDISFYLFSDGFQDQFGGIEDRKYLRKRFRNFLLSIHQFSFSQQKLLLEEEFLNWRGTRPQTDDVLVIGVQV